MNGASDRTAVGCNMTKRTEPADGPCMRYFVVVEATEEGADHVRLSGPFAKSLKAEVALDKIRAERPDALLLAVWGEPAERSRS